MAFMPTSLWLTLLSMLPCICALNSDGALLLTFKNSVISDPLSVLQGWSYEDETSCSWKGVTCSNTWEVISLVLPNAELLGSIPSALFQIQSLRHLDLSGNFLNGTLPATLLNASELRTLSLANNHISGKLPELATGRLSSLQLLNLSSNSLTGGIPTHLSMLPNLTVVSLSNNSLSGNLSSGRFWRLEVLDISSNRINGSLSEGLGRSNLRRLNLSHNWLTGSIPLELVLTSPFNTVLDLSFNNLTGQIPRSAIFLNQSSASFTGNMDLCGRPLSKQCAFLTDLSDPDTSVITAAPTAAKSPPALAVMPRSPNRDSLATAGDGGSRLRPAAILAITVGDVGGIAILLTVFLYVYHSKKKKKKKKEQQQASRGFPSNTIEKQWKDEKHECLSCCLKKITSDSDESSESSPSNELGSVGDGRSEGSHKHQEATLVTVDGETKLELESLLKASAYILGATASSIVYKAVLGDGTTLAVRRVGDISTTDRLKDFEAKVRSIAKFCHPNLLPIRALYWGADEKLLIHHFAPNGSLANIPFTSKTCLLKTPKLRTTGTYLFLTVGCVCLRRVRGCMIGGQKQVCSSAFHIEKLGSLPLYLSWASRLCIATGVAKGLAYLHEKKCVHGNIKPSNILLSDDMEPWIADFGLDKLVPSTIKSARNFSSHRPCKSLSELPTLSSSCSPSGSYQAPEMLHSLKPSPKWDVYSFGVVLLELLAGRVFSVMELCQWNAGFVVEERSRVLRMADPVLRGEVAGKEGELLLCFKLGFACAATVPQRRPSMAYAAQVLDKMRLRDW